jgi:hypothetical protein
VNLNPYSGFGRVEPVVGAVLALPGAYDFVFDTPAGGKPGKFTFRVWVNDTTPPRIRALPSRRREIRLALTDSGSGVDLGSVKARVDGRTARFTYDRGVLTLHRVAAGQHRVSLTASDNQEAKNMEDVGRILPNTRTFSATLSVP